MNNTTTIKGKVSQRIKDRIAEIAKDEQRDEEEVAGSLIEAAFRVDDEEDQLTQQAIAEADAGGPFVDGEDVKRWLKSWGKDDEPPMPEATIRF